MFYDPTPRLIKIGDAVSQLANVLVMPNHKETSANESISGRCYRCGWRKLEFLINLVFGKNHCKEAYLKDIERAENYIKETYVAP